MVSGRWTGLDVPWNKRLLLKLTLAEDRLPTIGANSFVFRRSLLDYVRWDPYFFDMSIMHQAVAAGMCRVAKVKCGIVHLYCRTLGDFARKQDRRIRDFLFASQPTRAGPILEPSAPEAGVIGFRNRNRLDPADSDPHRLAAQAQSRLAAASSRLSDCALGL